MVWFENVIFFAKQYIGYYAFFWVFCELYCVKIFIYKKTNKKIPKCWTALYKVKYLNKNGAILKNYDFSLMTSDMLPNREKLYEYYHYLFIIYVKIRYFRDFCFVFAENQLKGLTIAFGAEDFIFNKIFWLQFLP